MASPPTQEPSEDHLRTHRQSQLCTTNQHIWTSTCLDDRHSDGPSADDQADDFYSLHLFPSPTSAQSD